MVDQHDASTTDALYTIRLPALRSELRQLSIRVCTYSRALQTSVTIWYGDAAGVHLPSGRESNRNSERLMAKEAEPMAEDPHRTAASGASSGAGRAVPPQGEPGTLAHTDHLLAFKRIVAADPGLQDQLAKAQSEDEFHQQVSDLGRQHGFSIAPTDSKEFVAHTSRLRAMVTEEGGPDPPDPGTAGGYTSSCESSDSCTFNIYKSSC
jgi:hypothetical protein